MSDISLEYNALRSEILKRMEFRQQQITMALTIAGVFLGIGTTTKAVSMIYPPLATFIAIGWAQNDLRIANIATYIRTYLEPVNPTLNWETHSQNRRTDSPFRGWLFTPFAHTGILVITQLLGMGIGVFQFTATPLEWVLVGVDIVSILAVLLVMSQRRDDSHQSANRKTQKPRSQSLQKHTMVVLTSDVPQYSLRAGDLGMIVLVHSTGHRYDVEFTTLDHQIVATVPLDSTQI